MTTALFDTCIVMDVQQKREPFFDDAHKLFLAVANRRIKGCLTAKSILDIYYLFHRQCHSVDETRKSISALLNLFEILDTSAIDCRKALLSGISDYEDAVMTETAIRERIDCVVTRNLRDYRNSSVTILSSEDLAAKICGVSDSGI
ncbi:MAG: PIN domain-containing protein [Clostridia bacterium]|nr:PIN domain-containing protein [Clostridia bacterium]